MTERICVNCSKTFDAPPSAIKRRGAKYCSRGCYLEYRWKQNGKCNQCGKPTTTRFCSKECQRAYWNTHGYPSTYSRYWRDKIELINSLGGKCVKCGVDDVRCMDIHHIDSSKKISADKGQYTWQRRFKDWRANGGNLELLCANCHRILTWEERNYSKRHNDLT